MSLSPAKQKFVDLASEMFFKNYYISCFIDKNKNNGSRSVFFCPRSWRAGFA